MFSVGSDDALLNSEAAALKISHDLHKSGSHVERWTEPHRWCADLAETPRTWSWRPRGSKRAARTCCPSWTCERRLPSGKDAGQNDWKRRMFGDVFCQSHFNNCMNEVLLSWSSGTCLHLCLHLYLHWPGLWRMMVCLGSAKMFSSGTIRLFNPNISLQCDSRALERGKKYSYDHDQP